MLLGVVSLIVWEGKREGRDVKKFISLRCLIDLVVEKTNLFFLFFWLFLIERFQLVLVDFHNYRITRFVINM